MRALLLLLLAAAPADAARTWRDRQAAADRLALELGEAPAELPPLAEGGLSEASPAARRAARLSAGGVRVFFCAATGRWAAEPTGALQALSLQPGAPDADTLAWSERFGDARCPWPDGDPEALRRRIRWDTTFLVRFPGSRHAAQVRAELEALQRALASHGAPGCHCHP